MKLTRYSHNRLLSSLEFWHVDREVAEPMYNYLVHGFHPGDFFLGWYANDATAIVRSHPGNSVESLKSLTNWMVNCMPSIAWGSYDKVEKWLTMSDAERRIRLEARNLVFSEEEEIMKALKNEHTREPLFLW